MEPPQSFESMEELDRLAADIVIVVVPELMVPQPVVVLRLIMVLAVPNKLMLVPTKLMLVPTKLMLVQPMVELKPIMVALVQLVRELDSSSNCIR